MLTKHVQKVMESAGRLLRGQNILVEPARTQEQWDRAFAGGKWDFLTQDRSGQCQIAIVGSLLWDLLEKKKKAEKLRVLDVGCGNGAVARWAWQFRDRCEYTGIDVSQVALEKLRLLHPEAVLHCADMHTPPTFVDSFDVVVLAEVLCYGDYLRIVDIYASMLDAHGMFIISMYRTWKTRAIWHYLNRRILTLVAFTIRHETTRNTWRVALCRPKHKHFTP